MLNMSKQKAKNFLSFLFGGRVAEEQIFKDFTSGASNDIQKATDLARRMVCEWGMSSKVGPLFLGRGNDPVFLGKTYNDNTEYSEDSAKNVDSEIKNFIQKAYEKAQKIIQEKITQLHTMAEALLRFETIDSEEIDMIMHGKNLSDLENYRKTENEKINKERKTSADKKNKSEDDPLGGSALPSPVV
ncbi:MAG: cell division protein FtsH, partial [Bdellovibrionaceae bacterium]|nr:cell division protein FtsH [Pseudobdellovibrionaceae bacterium]